MVGMISRLKKKNQQKAKERPLDRFSTLCLNDEAREAVEKINATVKEWRDRWRLVNARNKGEFF